MLRPEPMARVLVVGPKDALARVIETLYDLKLVHLVDHHGEDDTIGIGKPLPQAAEVSEQLVKLRSIANILQVEEAKEAEAAPAAVDIRQQIATLELNLREDDEARKRIESLLQDLDRRMAELRPFAALRLPLETYRGYDSLEVLVGRVTDDVRGLDTVAPANETVTAEGLVAVFVPKDQADGARTYLGRFGFTPIRTCGRSTPSSSSARRTRSKRRSRRRRRPSGSRPRTIRS